MSNVQFVDQAKKPEDFPNEVYFCFTNEGELQQTANEATVTYIRADIAKERERLMIEAAYYRGCFDCENDHGELKDSLDVIYQDAGLEKLK